MPLRPAPNQAAAPFIFPQALTSAAASLSRATTNFSRTPGPPIPGAPRKRTPYAPAEPFEGQAYQDGGHTYFHNSLIWGEDLVDISITGLGMINGGGLSRRVDYLDEVNGYSTWNPTNPPPFTPLVETNQAS